MPRRAELAEIASREQLQQLLHSVVTKTEFIRVQCVWLKVELNLNAGQIAAAVGWHPASVRNLHSRFAKQGMAALHRKPRGGRHRENLSPSRERELLAGFARFARATHRLNVIGIWIAYERAVGRPVPKSTIYRMLKRHGLSRYLNQGRNQ
jgi:transposase